jgi:hypothetical protein
MLSNFKAKDSSVIFFLFLLAFYSFIYLSLNEEELLSI